MLACAIAKGKTLRHLTKTTSEHTTAKSPAQQLPENLLRTTLRERENPTYQTTKGMICWKSMKFLTKPACVDWSHAFFGTATVGEKGQLVIPAEARAEMNMQPGDKLLIMRHPVHAGLMMFKFDAVKEFVDDFQRNLVEYAEKSAEEPA